MIIIRKEQMSVFEKTALKHFENEMVAHLNLFAAKHCKVIGEVNVRETIQLGIQRAQKYGLTNRGPVRFFIEMMFMFGSEFDTDPQYPWADEILSDTNIMDQIARADRLYTKMLTYLENVAGPNNAYAIRALHNIRLRVNQPLSVSKDFFEREMLSEMHAIYPEKCKFTGDHDLNILIREGIKSAEIHSVQSIRGVMLFVVLMFALGHGFVDDPLFPWIIKTMKDPLVTDPDKKAERIERKAITYLDNVIAYHDQG